MTNEEAIEVFEGINELEGISMFYQSGGKAGKLTIHAIKEACRMATDALRAQQESVKPLGGEAAPDLSGSEARPRLDRSGWEGCTHCDHKCCCTCIHSTTDMNDEPCRTCCAVASKYRAGKFCPNCGRPLTGKAWAELERRIGGKTI